MQNKIDSILEQLYQEDPRYDPEAYSFILEALSFTQKKFKRSKHVNGKELLEGIKVLLMEQFGPMSMTVLEHWGIKSTEDFGNIVFHLVQKRILSKTDADDIGDFKDVFDFDQVFDQGYRQGLAKKISRMR